MLNVDYENEQNQVDASSKMQDPKKVAARNSPVPSPHKIVAIFQS